MQFRPSYPVSKTYLEIQSKIPQLRHKKQLCSLVIELHLNSESFVNWTSLVLRSLLYLLPCDFDLRNKRFVHVPDAPFMNRQVPGLPKVQLHHL